jgi:prophage DNA circulation protein
MTTAHAFLAGVVAVMSFTRVRRAIALTLVGALVVGVALPPPAQAQIGIGAVLAAASAVVRTINNLIQGLFNVANGLLSDISGVLGAFRQLMETVVYPQNLIDRARGLIASMIGTFRGILSSLFNINVTSAQLPDPTALESIIRNRATGDFGALTQTYTRTYGSLPPTTDAAPMDRDLIDMDDATAQALLKTLKEADAVSDRTIAASLAMEDEAKVAAPGTADYIVAAGVIAAVQNQAVMQKMIAAEMREEAARLAHRSMMWKRNSMFGSQLRQDVNTMLKAR